MLSEKLAKIKGYLRANENDLFTALIIVLTAISAFGLGRLSAIYDAKTPIVIKNSAGVQQSVVKHSVSNVGNDADGSFVQHSVSNNSQQGKYLASKNGKKYYPADCPAATRIAEVNRVWFNSAVEAEQAGLTLSVSCQ